MAPFLSIEDVVRMGLHLIDFHGLPTHELRDTFRMIINC